MGGALPANFENRACLVGGEIARIEGSGSSRPSTSTRRRSRPRKNGLVHNEALCHFAPAARFYLARGFKTIADAYLKTHGPVTGSGARWARSPNWSPASRIWKVAPVASSPGTTIESPVSQMDAEIVIKAAQTLSSEINPIILIEKLIRLTVEYAGAQRGLLILLHGDVPYIEGEARFERGDVDITIRHALVEPDDLLQPALQYIRECASVR